MLKKKLKKINSLVNRLDRVKVDSETNLKMGIDLGTSNIVTVVIDSNDEPIAALMTGAEVVRDGVVVDFFGAVSIVSEHLEKLKSKIPNLPMSAITSFPPGTEARISVNVLEAAGLEIESVIDEPSAVAHLLDLDNVAIVDIGGGTTGVAIIKNREVVHSDDEATGGHHISLTISGNQKISLEEAEVFKKEKGEIAWTISKPVFEKMTEIVSNMIENYEVSGLFLSGGSCMMPGVCELFEDNFSNYEVILPEYAIFLTPYAIASYRKD